jgi:hypothetical protein
MRVRLDPRQKEKIQNILNGVGKENLRTYMDRFTITN